MLRTANFEELPQALLRLASPPPTLSTLHTRAHIHIHIPFRQLMQDHVHDEGVRVKVTADDYPLLRIWTRGLYMQRKQVAYRVIETPMYAMVRAPRPQLLAANCYQARILCTQVFVAVRVKSQAEPEDIYLKVCSWDQALWSPAGHVASHQPHSAVDQERAMQAAGRAHAQI